MPAMDTSWDSAAFDELLLALAETWPDPVDLVEDDLARANGVFRFPALATEDWRRVRMRAIEAADPEADVT